MPQTDFTLEDVKKLFVAEREFTRTLLKEELTTGVNSLRDEFQSFIDNNFEPAIDRIDQRFDQLEDRVDHLTADVSELRIDMRHVKQVLRHRDVAA